MAEETPAAPAPTGESVANNPTNTNTNEAPAEAPATPSVDLHGFTSEQLGEMKKFFDNNGGFDAIKSKISNPQKTEPAQQAPAQTQQPQQAVPTNNPQPVAQPQQGIRTATALAMEMYFEKLAQKPEYAGFSKEITDGSVIKEMLGMGMNPVLSDGSINIDQLGKFLDLKAKGAPAPQPTATPVESAAPTVSYIEVGDAIASKEQALDILKQSAQMRAIGQAEHPATAKAKEFLKTHKL